MDGRLRRGAALGRQGRADRVRVALRGRRRGRGRGLAALERYLGELLRALEAAFGEELRAVYLMGSAAVGAYRDGSSDVDVLVAVGRAQPDALDRVVATCSHAALPCPARKLELVVYELAALAAPGEHPAWSLNLNTGAGEQHAGRDPSHEPHWFVLDLAFARGHARPLLGPSAGALVGEPGDAAVARAFSEMVRWFEENEPEGAAIARARAEHWRATGEFLPKTETTLGS